MERNIIINEVKNKLLNSKNGEVFIISDFLDIGNYDAIRKVLSRLVKEGCLIRILRGMYKKPNYNNFIQREIPASPDEVAKALARANNWTIGPKGDAALNILGLSTQVPAVYHYISDGPNKNVNYEGITIAFKKRSNKEISGYSYKTILIIEAIKTLGPLGMNDEIRQAIAKKCDISDFKLLNEDGRNSRRWIYEEIKKITKLGGLSNAEISKTVK